MYNRLNPFGKLITYYTNISLVLGKIIAQH